MSAGQTKEAVNTVLTNELKRTDNTSRCEIMEKSGVKNKVYLDNKKVLAMKVDSDMSYSQLRKQRKYFKEAGIVLPNEQKQRKLVNEITQNFLTMQSNAFDGEQGEEIIAPIGSIENLTSFIENHLDLLKQNNQLIWHERIPENEIWIKFGGDHGKNSFKLTMQVVNVHKPNSKENTIVFAMANVKDRYDNLNVIMSLVKPKLDDLTKMQWDGKSIKLFVFGDYDFYSKVFGISGARGTFPCLWCHIPNRELQIPYFKASEKRTLQFGFGLGLHGEQGGELIHSTVSKLERIGRHIRNDEKRMKTVMKSHLLLTSPDLKACQPETKKRK